MWNIHSVAIRRSVKLLLFDVWYSKNVKYPNPVENLMTRKPMKELELVVGPKVFDRTDVIQTLVLGFFSSLAAVLFIEVIKLAPHSSAQSGSWLASLPQYWISNMTSVNLWITACTVIVYFILAISLPKQTRWVFLIWTLAWSLQFGSVVYRTKIENPTAVNPPSTTAIDLGSTAGEQKIKVNEVDAAATEVGDTENERTMSEHLQISSILNAGSTSILLFGSLFLRERRKWFFLLPAIPILSLFFDAETRALVLTFVNFVVLVYFALAILDKFRDYCWVPAYFTFGWYCLYAGAQLLYIVERYFEIMKIGGNPLEIVTVVGYSFGAIAKGGGAVGMLVVVIGAIQERYLEKN